MLAQLDAKEAAEKAEGLDERKRKYNSMVEDKGPTEEEMEAWKLRKHMASDPMANYSDEKRWKRDIFELQARRCLFQR